MISAPAGSTIYTFDGVAFYREGGDRLQPWFLDRVEYTRDIVLGGENLDYLHIGASTRDEFEIRAIVFDLSSRNSLMTKAANGTTAVLNKSDGKSLPASLVRAVPEDPKTKSYYLVVLTFVPRQTGGI